MRLVHTDVVVDIVGQEVHLTPSMIEELKRFLVRYSCKNVIWFAVDHGGALYVYNHEPSNAINFSDWACGNNDDDHCEELGYLSVEWDFNKEWKTTLTGISTSKMKKKLGVK